MKIQNYILFLCLFCMISFSFAGITGKIAGKVTDAESGEPIPGANVFIDGTIMGSATDLNGEYFIVNVPPGTYTVTISMIGYETVNMSQVRVMVDQTTPLNFFELKPTLIEGETITVTATREIVHMDVSSSVITSESEEVVTLPLITSVQDYIQLLAGVENDLIRGGGLDQVGYEVDGLMMVDGLQARPMNMVNLSAMKEVSVIRGGFNAEYGNVRSGLIRVVTKDGSGGRYNGSVDFRYTPARLKHNDVSIMDPNNYEHRAYLDPAVAWEGTENGSWSDEKRARNKRFMGWNAWAATKLADEDPNNDLTPEQWRDMYLWTHAMEGAKNLQPADYEQRTGRESHENLYGEDADWFMDLSFSGPVPFISESLGDLNFFLSYRTSTEQFPVPRGVNAYEDDAAFLKFVSNITDNFKLTVEGMYGEILTSASNPRDAGDSPGSFILNGADDPAVFGIESWEADFAWWPAAWVPVDIYQSMVGLRIDHTINKTTFYNVSLNYVTKKNWAPGPRYWRQSAWMDPTNIIRNFGPMGVDERPWGFESKQTDKKSVDGAFYSSEGGEYRDWSSFATTNLLFDLSSQIHPDHLVKTGLNITYDELNNHYALDHQTFPSNNYEDKWSAFPIRIGVYLQDKFEFEGMIANFGLRGDYYDSNTDWYDADRYSDYFSARFKDQFEENVPTQPAKSHFFVSPRLGISHPIDENTKLYFNYGHFYSPLAANNRYKIGWGIAQEGISYIGNPSAVPARTIQYELGFEYNLLNEYFFHISGYYKDVSDQHGNVNYVNIDGSVNYGTSENKNYADIRGFEIRIDKKFGQWITGWINYNYMVTTSGFLGRETYYQDPRLQLLEGYQNPYQELPLAEPYARANLRFFTPYDFGPELVGFKPLSNWAFSFLYQYQDGQHFTWDPLNTFKLVDNIQWKDYHNVDLRISWDLIFDITQITLFADVRNLFNIKHLNPNAGDREKYMKSLKLPMYNGTEGATKEQYAAKGFHGGDDQPGDIGGPGTDKSYIYMPVREYLWYLDERFVTFGIRASF